MDTSTQIEARRRAASRVIHNLIDVNGLSRIVDWNAEAHELLREAQREITALIAEVNEHRMSKVNGFTETPPDLADGETCYKIQELLRRGIK